MAGVLKIGSLGMTDKEFYSLKICPNCKYNNKRQADLYLLHGKGKCWTCGEEMKNFARSELSKQKGEWLEKYLKQGDE